jgi:cytochrome c-type biogenesis protein CcmH
VRARAHRRHHVHRGRAAPIAGGRCAAIALAGLLLAAVAAPGSLASVAPRASLPTISRQVMCVSCKIPLDVADSPQADRERAFIESLIEQGQSEAQIKRALVAQYGPAVLGMPSTHGFDLAAYLVPAAVVLALMGTLALLLPRWRRHARAQAAARSAAPALSALDAARLDSDIARFD